MRKKQFKRVYKYNQHISIIDIRSSLRVYESVIFPHNTALTVETYVKKYMQVFQFHF